MTQGDLHYSNMGKCMQVYVGIIYIFVLRNKKNNKQTKKTHHFIQSELIFTWFMILAT